MEPRWRGDGRESCYVANGTLIAVSASTDEGFTVGQPQALFEDSGFTLGYDVSADGQRFLAVAPVESADALPPEIRVVQNWYEEFRDREQ